MDKYRDKLGEPCCDLAGKPHKICWFFKGKPPSKWLSWREFVHNFGIAIGWLAVVLVILYCIMTGVDG